MKIKDIPEEKIFCRKEGIGKEQSPGSYENHWKPNIRVHPYSATVFQSFLVVFPDGRNQITQEKFWCLGFGVQPLGCATPRRLKPVLQTSTSCFLCVLRVLAVKAPSRINRQDAKS